MSIKGDIRIADWRRSFLRAGGPLVFVTVFKILDMLIEWVLAQNGLRPTFRFAQKIVNLETASPIFPSAIESRPWLRERLVALYQTL